jgi:hypothetical protein
MASKESRMKLNRKRPLPSGATRVRIRRIPTAMAVLGIAGMVAAVAVGADPMACGTVAACGLGATAFA